MVWRPLGCSPIGDADHRTLPTSMIRSDVQRADRDPAAIRRQHRTFATSTSDGRFVPSSVCRGSPDNIGFRETTITKLMSALRAYVACLLSRDGADRRIRGESGPSGCKLRIGGNGQFMCSGSLGGSAPQQRRPIGRHDAWQGWDGDHADEDGIKDISTST